MHFTTDRAFVVLIAVVFALCLIGVGALRRGPFGRRLVAMSDSEAACATVGMNITRTKFAVFVVAGGMAGLSGALYGGMSRRCPYSQFELREQPGALRGRVPSAGVTILTGRCRPGSASPWCRSSPRTFPSLAGFTYILFGAGIIAVGRNPYGVGPALLASR